MRTHWHRGLRGMTWAAIAVVAGGMAVRADDGASPPPGSIEQLSRAVNGELSDVAGALRGLDQSYVYRGFQGCGSATAGSVHIDWVAKGVPPEQRARVLPPQPLVLSQSQKQPCHKAAEPQPQPRPIVEPASAPAAAPCPCQSAGPAVTHATPQAVYPGAVREVIPQAAPIVRSTPPADAYQPAEIVYHGCRSCGGRVPPNAVLRHGQWTEAPAGYGWGYGTNSAPGVRVAPGAVAYPLW